MAENAVDQARPAPVVRPVWLIVLTVFLPFAGGYFLSYLYRSLNAIIAPDLTAEIGLTAGDLGLLTAAYFFAFAAFQIPLGLLLDRFGPRRVQACLLLSAAAGALVFANGDDSVMLTVGRAMIGLGVAGGLMASFKAIVMWFPQHRWPLVNGLFLTCGGLGALSATTPVEALLQITDWRGLFVGLAAINVAVAAAIFFVVPERRTGAEATALRAALVSLGEIYRDAYFWRLAPLSFFTLAAGLAFQGLWAGPWLKDVVGLGREGVASNLFWLAALLTAGFALNGIVADLLTRRGVSLERVIGGGALLFLLAQIPLVLGWAPGLPLVWLGMGLLANITALNFPLLTRHFGPALSGRSSTALNMLNFGCAFATQYAIGAIIDLWPPVAEGAYAPVAYQVAFGVVLAAQVLAWLWFLRPTC